MPENIELPKPVRPHAPIVVTGLSTWQKIKIFIQLKHIFNGPMKINGSWKTTVFGAGGIFVIVANVASILLDGDPNTNPDWGVTFAALMPSIAALFARDNNKTSEDVGIK